MAEQAHSSTETTDVGENLNIHEMFIKLMNRMDKSDEKVEKFHNEIKHEIRVECQQGVNSKK
jgi:hypothetical protein